MSSKFRNILLLLRVRQYYKNVLIFVGSFFSASILSIRVFPTLVLGFIILCCASSINYIINDIVDIEKDKHHPEKLIKKPLASGELSKIFAISLLVILSAFIVLALIFVIPSLGFTVMVILIIITGQLYNHILKNHAFLDIITLSLLYLWRALAGCLLVNVYISPWLFLAIVEIALFLVIAKRKGDLLLLGDDKAKKHKKIYEQYTIKILEQFHVIIATSLFVTYALYLILRFSLFNDQSLDFSDYLVFMTIPIMLYIIMRYMYLTSEKPEIARNTEKAFFDKGIVIAAGILMLLLGYALYFESVFGYFIENYNLPFF